MVEDLLQSFTARDAMVIAGCAISTYFIAREARREARAANRRIDMLVDGKNGKPGIPERVTRLEEGRKTARGELLRVRDSLHHAINTQTALIGYTDHAIDIVGDAVGRTLPHPKLALPTRTALPPEEEPSGDDEA